MKDSVRVFIFTSLRGMKITLSKKQGESETLGFEPQLGLLVAMTSDSSFDSSLKLGEN